MSTQKETKTTFTLEQLAEALGKIEQSQTEILMGQEKTALNLQGLDQRLTMMEGQKPKLDNEAAVEAAVAAIKPGIIGGFKQASTTKKVVLATVGTAAVAGAVYGGYKGMEYYNARKAAGVPLIAVEAVPSVSPAKSDALRQALK